MAEVEFPGAFAKRMQIQLRGDWSSFVSAHQVSSPTSVRVNPRKLPQMAQMDTGGKTLWSDLGYYLKQRPSFTLDPLFHAGTYYVQEASSMFLEQALKQTVDLSRSLRVLDLCAAPGGKSTHLLSLINGQSLLVSNEVIRTRATILAENISKWGNINGVVTNNDPEDFKNLSGFFDVIVIDAPCSGEGLFRKDPEAMSEWSEDNASLCATRQHRILNQVWPALKQNGILIYSTCTYNKQENEQHLIELVKSGRAKSLPLKIDDVWGIDEKTDDDLHGYQFYPHKTKGEGFFISVVQKIESEYEIGIRSNKKFEHPSRKITDQLKGWLKSQEVEFISQDDLIIGLPKEYKEEIEFVSKNLRVIQKGTAIATLKHDKLIPEHSFALSTEINASNFFTFELTLEQALAYLRKDTLTLDSEKKGFTLLTYQNTPIGWMNHLGNRSNNLYPAAWRIRI